VFFPRPEEVEGIEAIFEQYTQVVCVGKASKFNDTLSYTVSAMFTAKINFDSIKLNVSKPVPEHYRTVMPENCVSMQQQSLLDGGAAAVSEFFKSKSFVIFDLETTSKMVDSAHIVQISALKIVDGVEKQSFDTFVKPPIHIPEDVVEVHHIDDETVVNAPKIEEVIPDFYKFTRGAILVGHNIIGYDYPIINRVASESGYIFDNELLDTLTLARKYMPEMSNFKLTTLSKNLKIEHENAHRADSDVFATWGVLKEVAKRM
ncbi:MAG: 3'-5' exonuclease, partial [Clostridia bacterium]|nr:3'-5' exonuclease [Clostridia bacterium]